MSAERVTEARHLLHKLRTDHGCAGIPRLLSPNLIEEFENAVVAFELAVRSDQRARDFPPATIDAEEGAA